MHLLCRIKYCLQQHKIRKSKNRADVKAITKKINKTNGTSFDEGFIAINISRLLNKKIPLH